eukprot:3964589-Prymnesium_polylepis.1
MCATWTVVRTSHGASPRARWWSDLLRAFHASPSRKRPAHVTTTSQRVRRARLRCSAVSAHAHRLFDSCGDAACTS